MKEACCLEKIQIKNVRSLSDTGLVSLSKVTLLVGENSSGKSSFLRTFPLIKQSISKRTNGPILWAGDIDDYVDFGSFGETVTNDGSKSMSFTFQFELTLRSIVRLIRQSVFKNISHCDLLTDKVTYSFTVSRKESKEYISDLRVLINSNSFEFMFLADGHPDSICVNQNVVDVKQEKKHLHIVYSQEMGSSSIFGFNLPSVEKMIYSAYNFFMEDKSTAEEEDDYLFFKYETQFHNCVCRIGALLSKNVSISHMQDIINNTAALSNNETAQNQLDRIIINKLVEIDTSMRDQWTSRFMLAYFYRIFSEADDYLRTYFRQVHYIAPLRATAERYYRLRNLAIDEVDYQGKNLAVFLSGLPKGRLQNFQNWTLKHFGFKIVVDKTEGHVSVKVSLHSGGYPINISDTGFGYSQILPIITQLWDLSTTRKLNAMSYNRIPLVIAIEQPELHLHPSLQAKLVEALIASIELADKNNNQLQLILETHSETIVNYFGKMIAKGQIDNNDVSVLLFERDTNTRKTEVRTSNYDSNGYLNDWPIGFFAP